MTDEPHALTGVVPEQGEFPDMPRQASAYQDAHAHAVEALSATDERLRSLRKHRDETEAEIKSLVGERELLERMARVTKKP